MHNQPEVGCCKRQTYINSGKAAHSSDRDTEQIQTEQTSPASEVQGSSSTLQTQFTYNTLSQVA